jgi:DNA-binding MarR family transcriptional regulator
VDPGTVASERSLAELTGFASGGITKVVSRLEEAGYPTRESGVERQGLFLEREPVDEASRTEKASPEVLDLSLDDLTMYD